MLSDDNQNSDMFTVSVFFKGQKYYIYYKRYLYFWHELSVAYKLLSFFCEECSGNPALRSNSMEFSVIDWSLYGNVLVT